MPIRVTCPSCGRSGRVPDHAAGKKVACPACGYRYQLPADSAPTALPEGLELLNDEPTPTPRPQPKPEPDFRPAPRTVPKPKPAALDDPYDVPEAIPWTVRQNEPKAASASNWALYAGIAGAAVVGLLVIALIYEATRDRLGRQAVAEAKAAGEAGFVAEARVAAGAPERPDGGDRTLSTAEIINESDASIALIRGKSSSGTGFLVGPGLLATNSHVIDDEFLSKIQVYFPAADARRKGPLAAELLYEDPARDLAFLAVETDLPALRVANSYKFKKGEDVTVIGSPGIGNGKVLENAVSRGVMSTHAELNGKSFYQLGIAVNPGNSGGPVFDSAGRVIGVVTLKTPEQEALAFCVPVEDLRAALTALASQTPADAAKLRSRHRVVHAVEGLGTAGAVYVAAIGGALAVNSGQLSADDKGKIEKLQAALPELDTVLFNDILGEVPAIRDDGLLAENVRAGVGQLADNFGKLRAIQARGSSVSGDQMRALMTSHKQLIVDLSAALGLAPPTPLLAVFEVPPDAGGGRAVLVTPPIPGQGTQLQEFRRRMFERRGFAPPGVPRPPGASPPGMPRPPTIGPRGRVGPRGGSSF